MGQKVVKQFLTSGVFTVPAGVYRGRVRMWGGGGGGCQSFGGATSGNNVTNNSGPGGGGSLEYELEVPLVPGHTYSVTIGAGGNGGIGVASGLGTNATDGGDTILTDTTAAQEIARARGAARGTGGGGSGEASQTTLNQWMGGSPVRATATNFYERSRVRRVSQDNPAFGVSNALIGPGPGVGGGTDAWQGFHGNPSLNGHLGGTPGTNGANTGGSGERLGGRGGGGGGGGPGGPGGNGGNGGNSANTPVGGSPGTSAAANSGAGGGGAGAGGTPTSGGNWAAGASGGNGGSGYFEISYEVG